jgi:hypothetical protein
VGGFVEVLREVGGDDLGVDANLDGVSVISRQICVEVQARLRGSAEYESHKPKEGVRKLKSQQPEVRNSPKVRRAAYARLRGEHKNLETRSEVCIDMCM